MAADPVLPPCGHNLYHPHHGNNAIMMRIEKHHHRYVGARKRRARRSHGGQARFNIRPSTTFKKGRSNMWPYHHLVSKGESNYFEAPLMLYCSKCKHAKDIDMFAVNNSLSGKRVKSNNYCATCSL